MLAAQLGTNKLHLWVGVTLSVKLKVVMTLGFAIENCPMSTNDLCHPIQFYVIKSHLLFQILIKMGRQGEENHLRGSPVKTVLFTLRQI